MELSKRSLGVIGKVFPRGPVLPPEDIRDENFEEDPRHVGELAVGRDMVHGEDE